MNSCNANWLSQRKFLLKKFIFRLTKAELICNDVDESSNITMGILKWDVSTYRRTNRTVEKKTSMNEINWTIDNRILHDLCRVCVFLNRRIIEHKHIQRLFEEKTNITRVMLIVVWCIRQVADNHYSERSMTFERHWKQRDRSWHKLREFDSYIEFPMENKNFLLKIQLKLLEFQLFIILWLNLVNRLLAYRNSF